jgi:nitrilase
MDESTVRIAAIQATPVILDAEATVEKACRLIGEAASDGAKLVVLPEAFVSLYPSNAWAKGAGAFGGWDELWERFWESSVDVPGPLTERLAEACREHDAYLAIGVNERESERPGSLYNTLLVLGPEGLLHKHRKLMPTMHERLFHGIGAGDDLGVIPTAAGRIGGLICWENRMPLARYAVYCGGPQIWVAPTADDSDGWLASMRHIAIEAGCFRGLGAAVHPRLSLSGGLPRAAAGGQGGVRQRRGGDRRTGLRHRDRRAAPR